MNLYRQRYDINPIDITCSSSHEDFNNEEREARRRRHLRDDLRDLKVEALEFDGSLNPENYFDWV